MSKVIRYVHIRDTDKGGATVKITGDLDFPGQVDVQWVRCSKKDNYVKEVGRNLATTAPIKVVPLRYLPKELTRIAESVGSFDALNGFEYMYKYFLPKE